MSQSSLIEKIKEDATQVIADIEAAAAAEVETIGKEVAAALKEKEVELTTQLDKKLAHHELVALSKAKQTGNILYQTAKREEINALFNDLEAEIASLASDEYISFVLQLTEEVLPKNLSPVKVVAPKDRLTETKTILTTLQLEVPIEAGSVFAGIVVHAKEGVYDASFNRLLNEQRPQLEIELMNMIQTS